VTDISHLLRRAVDVVTGSREDPRRQSLLKMIASILNKEQNDARITDFVNSVVTDMWTSIQDYDRRKETLELISWVISSVLNFSNSSLRKHLYYEQMPKDTA
jgi:hypothetical protein